MIKSLKLVGLAAATVGMLTLTGCQLLGGNNNGGQNPAAPTGGTGTGGTGVGGVNPGGPTGGTTTPNGGTTGTTPGGTTTAGGPTAPVSPGGTTPQTPPPGDQRSAAEQACDNAMLTQINALRAQNGAGPLTLDNQLVLMASSHSLDMATRGYFGHFDPQGVGPQQRAQQANATRFAGENCAQGSANNDANATAAAFIEMYKGDQPHFQNMVNPAWKVAGFGTINRNGQSLNTQDFGQ